MLSAAQRRVRVLLLPAAAYSLSMAATHSITLYTNRLCPYAQRCAIALETAGLPYEKVEVDLYGSSGFAKSDLKQVEAAAGLSPKGYVPVLRVGDDVLRESTVCVDRIAALADALAPSDAAAAAWAIAHCDGPLATEGQSSVFAGAMSPGLERALRDLDARIAGDYLAGNALSTADAVCLPFLF
eukprot:CAMPEP_0119295438 /NCGR_PEP_ID=MMETSP1329-20130426/49742_1 /TAXON_ID=114041 /ORGANISM="Genus nov. species nov., Strain RCC1024" /LENGTH=183 /DNA_ID=CAMNT_0007296351 /DNA_START=143 /DNA_END=691 /DNA_ORIENTATION=-